MTDTLVEDPRWDAAGLETLADRAARATLHHLDLAPAGYEIAVLGCDDARIAALNADFRGKPQATNVLSWPSADLSARVAGAHPETPLEGNEKAPHPLGDIAIAHDTCRREAAEQGKRFEAHVTHLLVHATLHLLGYDHLRDADATLMEDTERAILAKLGIADLYKAADGG